MKVLLLTNKYPYPARDGSSIAIMNMIHGLLSTGCEVHLVALNASRVYVPPRPIIVDEPGMLRVKSMRVNTNITPWGILSNLFSSKSYHVSRFYNKKFEEELKDILMNTAFDIIQIEGVFMGVYLPIIRRASHAKVVLRAHNVEHFIWQRLISKQKSFKNLYISLQTKRLKKFEIDVLQKVDGVAAISEVDNKELKNLIADKKNKVHTVHFGLKTHRYKSYAEQTGGRAVVVYIASFDWLPNLQGIEWFLNKVWPSVVQKYPSAEFHLAGRNMPPKLKNRKDKGLRIIGEVSDTATFLQQGRLLVLPLLSGSGVRIKLLESLAVGIPVISTTIGAEGVDCKHGEHLLIADKTQDMVNAICLLLDDEGLRQYLGKNSRKLVQQQFDLKFISEDLINFYHRLHRTQKKDIS